MNKNNLYDHNVYQKQEYKVRFNYLIFFLSHGRFPEPSCFLEPGRFEGFWAVHRVLESRPVRSKDPSRIIRG